MKTRYYIAGVKGSRYKPRRVITLSGFRPALCALALILLMPHLVSADTAITSAKAENGDAAPVSDDKGCIFQWERPVPGGGLVFSGLAFKCDCSTTLGSSSDFWEGVARVDGSIAPGHSLHITGGYSFGFLANLPPDPPGLSASTTFEMSGTGKGTRCDVEHFQGFRLRFAMKGDSVRITEAMGKGGHATGVCDGVTIPVMPMIYPSGFDVPVLPYTCPQSESSKYKSNGNE